MKNLNKGTLALSILIALLCAGCSEEETVEREKYREEPYTLEDGTPCTIIHGGSHSGMVGVTCSY
jgi:hypothetical protein